MSTFFVNGESKKCDGNCLSSPKESLQSYSYEEIKEAADHILNLTKYRPKIAIICGSGLGGLAEMLTDSESFPYKSIPLLPTPTVVSHAGRIVIGKLNGVAVMCMQGRSHFYEGHPTWKCALPVRIMKLIGIKDLIVSNAAGGLNPSYKVGDIMLYKDHIFLQGFGGDTPLRGPNDERFGPRFPPMNKVYDKVLREVAKESATEGGFAHSVHEGTFTMLSGPAFESPAELKALRIFGTDAVGMSALPEVMVARHCDIRVLAFSLITNKCIMDPDKDEDVYVDVDTVGAAQHKNLVQMITAIVKEMNQN